MASGKSTLQLISAGLNRANDYIYNARIDVRFFSQTQSAVPTTHKSHIPSPLRAMSGPPDGKYLIILASAPPPFPLGADEVGPVSVGGAVHVVSPPLLFGANYA